MNIECCFPYEEIEPGHVPVLKVVETLLYYDGPILSHLRDVATQQDYIEFAVDEPEYDGKPGWRSCVLPVQPNQLKSYLDNKRTLRSLIDTTGFVVFRDDVENGQLWFRARFHDVPSDYLPTTDSFLRVGPCDDAHS